MKLSILVPVYNVAPYLEACLDSLMAAAKRLEGIATVEIVCVDDGSTDGGGEVLGEYVERLGSWNCELGMKVENSAIRNSSFSNPRFIVLHQANAGVGAARNTALEAATGDWIGFVDADDTVGERWLEEVVRLIAATPEAEIVKVGPLVSVRDGEAGVPARFGAKGIARSEAEAAARTAQVRKVRVCRGDAARREGLRTYARYGWSMMNFVRRDFLAGARFPVGLRLKEDVAFFVRLANRLTGWVEAEFPGYFYTRRDGSALMRPRSDEDSRRFLAQMMNLCGDDAERRRGAGELVRAVSTAIGYEFVQWAEERDPSLPYDARTCPLRAAWRQAARERRIDLGDLPFFWRPGIRLWMRFGWLWPAKMTRRLREWTARFI